VHVLAKDRATNKEQSITITGSSSLDKNDIERMVNEAAMHADEDHKVKEAAEARNQGDALVYQTEKLVKDLGDKLPSEQKLSVENSVSALQAALKGTDVEEIKKLTEELRQASYSLSEILYKQAAGDAGGQSPEEAGFGGGEPHHEEEAKPADDDVIDAEFKEK